jgi:hypothetical protein
MLRIIRDDGLYRVEDQDGNLWCVLNTINETYRKHVRSGRAEIEANVSLMEQFVNVAAQLQAS